MSDQSDVGEDASGEVGKLDERAERPLSSEDGEALHPAFLVAPPWYLASSGDGQVVESPVFWPNLEGDGWISPEEMDSLFSAAQVHQLSAVHEAGHVVVAASAGIPIDRVQLFTTPESTDGVEGVGGHAYLQELQVPVTLGNYGATLVAGRVAEVLWLAERGLLDARRLVGCDLHAVGDYMQLAEMEGPDGPVAVLFGPASVPDGWTGSVLRISALVDLASNVLRQNWRLLAVVANYLERHGGATGEQIQMLLNGGDPNAM